jgi:hypothetical protein
MTSSVPSQWKADPIDGCQTGTKSHILSRPSTAKYILLVSVMCVSVGCVGVCVTLGAHLVCNAEAGGGHGAAGILVSAPCHVWLGQIGPKGALGSKLLLGFPPGRLTRALGAAVCQQVVHRVRLEPASSER